LKRDSGDELLLEIENLRVWFGAAEVVRGVSLTAGAGEVLGLVGESGSGKSVTSLAILGLLDPRRASKARFAGRGRELLGLPECASCERFAGDRLR
jgi:ABC-type glutathione transport system ATPase component